MLLCVLFMNLLIQVYCDGTIKQMKPYIFPIPFEMPNRNDRADQCWLRIEDVEITETLTIYCRIARAFLRSYIPEYNLRKMTEDDVNVSVWTEESRSPEDTLTKPETDKKTVKDWKFTTVMDPLMHMRLYVSQNADCRLVMYSRDGTSNYKVDCETLLYFVNDHLQNSAVFLRDNKYLIVLCVFLIFTNIPITWYN
ncbi:uncharacterized protein LOC128202200 [Galleria mellonella]|uniref:Uncharacterized protein LOC128202200 n=1 Tax=Galleria mellonella TaxID=7137 RepID=A0ABM3N1V5_GALME|nr:uncharacterized protein LOC128202200 [Galleria mellonella]